MEIESRAYLGSKPVFVDNQDDNTLTRALRTYLDQWYQDFSDPPIVSIATGYFNPDGFFSIADQLEDVAELRLLLGTEPSKKDRQRWRYPDEPRGDEYEQKRIEEGLESLHQDLETDRNLLGFTQRNHEQLRHMVDFFRDERMEVRLFTEGFVHGKAFIFSRPDEPEGVISGSSNFTGAGLNRNLELNLGRYEPQVTHAVNEWFEDLWIRSEEFDLAELYEERLELYEPYLVYLRVLWERYREEMQQEQDEQDGRIELTTFQNDGVFRAKRFLDEHNGVIVADGVGLGKTYIAGELIRQAVEERRQRALVIAPASLRDGMWSSFKGELNVHFDILSYSQIRQDRQLGGDRANLNQDKDEYQLVVIDEAHAFRNPGTDQAYALRRLLQGDPPKDLVLLTATPVNNSLWDLYYLLEYFVNHDAVFASEGIPSLREHFKRAQKIEPENLSPDMLFDVLDQTTVRRTRHFVKQHYQGDTITKGDIQITIKFPDPEPIRKDYQFSESFDDTFFQSVAGGLGAEDDHDPELTLARYTPSKYKRGQEWDGSELALAGLLRTGILKRFESSRNAFISTLNRMRQQNQAALDLLERGILPEPEAIDEWMESDNDEAFDEIFDWGQEIEVTQENFEIDEFRRDVQTDLDLMNGWIEQAERVQLEDDGKLTELRRTLREIVNQAAEDVVDDQEQERTNRKVLIFSYFEDTVDWILDYLERIVSEDETLSVYEDRIAGVAGTESKRGISRERAVYGFAPDSTESPPGTPDEFDILVTTDVLAQGVNLQQCRNVINYDLPWNPMRVVQRNGRIDRIGSEHNRIHIYTFFAEDRLDQLLHLEQRIRRKLTQAARSVGIESDVIPESEQQVDRNFADRREDIERLREEDHQFLEEGGDRAAAYSGEEYRQELRSGLQDREEEIKSLPWGAGSGFVGDQSGYFFCARIGEKVFLRFVPDDLEDEEDILTESLSCLKIIECEWDTKREVSERMQNKVFEAWEMAKENIYQHWQRQTDPMLLQPDIRKLFREVAEHIRTNPPENRTQDEIETILESVEAPWGRRYERELRQVWRQDLGPQQLTHELIEKIEELGLQPFEAPEPAPPIEEDEVMLVCWMVVTKE